MKSDYPSIRWADFHVSTQVDLWEMLFPMSANQTVQIGRVDFRSDRRPFGIKKEDRFSHIYLIGKTGTGKSTLIETMALQDLEHGNGFALSTPMAISPSGWPPAFRQHGSRIPSTSILPIPHSHTGTIPCARYAKNLFRSPPPV
jgi:hypothetical protein